MEEAMVKNIGEEVTKDVTTEVATVAVKKGTVDALSKGITGGIFAFAAVGVVSTFIGGYKLIKKVRDKKKDQYLTTDDFEDDEHEVVIETVKDGEEEKKTVSKKKK